MSIFGCNSRKSLRNRLYYNPSRQNNEYQVVFGSCNEHDSMKYGRVRQLKQFYCFKYSFYKVNNNSWEKLYQEQSVSSDQVQVVKISDCIANMQMCNWQNPAIFSNIWRYCWILSLGPRWQHSTHLFFPIKQIKVVKTRLRIYVIIIT